MSQRSIYSTLVLLLGTLIAVGKSPIDTFPFFQGTWEELQGKAKQLEKPYFIYFHQNLSDADFNGSRWKNDELLFFIDRNYLAYHIDVSEEENPFLEKYELRRDHSFLFFDSEGEVMGLQEGNVSAKELLSVLETLFFQLGDPNWTFYNGRQTLDTVLLANTTTKGTEDVEEKIGSSRSDKLPSISEKLAKYTLSQLPDAQKDHFSILLATYSNLEELVEVLEKLQRVWKGKLWVHQNIEAEKNSFQVLLGSYIDQQNAGYFVPGIERLTEKKVKILPLNAFLN